MIRDEVITKIREKLPDLRREYAIEELYLFGSVARGDDGPDSDVDVLVKLERDAVVPFSRLWRLQDALEELVGRKVDLVTDHPWLRPWFRAELERDRVRVD